VFAPAGAQVGWLLLAVVLHVCGQVSRGVAWRGVLAVSWPHVTRRRVCAWYVCGAGLSGVLSVRGGDAVRAALAKRELKDATWPALAGTLAAEASLESACGVLLVLSAVWLGVGTLNAPSPVLAAAAAVAVGAVVTLAVRSQRVRRAVCEVGRGLAVMRRPRCWARGVLPWQVLSRALRLGSATCFLLAFGLPIAPAVVVAACLAQGSGGAMPVPGAGPATAGAALLVAIPLAAHAVDHGAVASLAIVWPAALTAVGVTLSLVLLAHVCGARTPRALVRAARALRAQPAPLTP
jgi:Lysylphosphatidylglycerol synthase TM region